MLTHKVTKYPNHGFTIVELLIVIVVIGILAAITIVAYNGIANRAIDSKMASTADALKKKVLVKQATDGKASPTNNPSSIQAVRQHYGIENIDQSTLIQSFDVDGSCIESRSDTCDYDDPRFNQVGTVLMGIFPTGTSGGWCTYYGGVSIAFIRSDGEVFETSIADEPGREIGAECSGGGEI